MRGKCAPAGFSCPQPGFAVGPVGRDSPGKRLIVIKCDHLLMSEETSDDCLGVLIFTVGLADRHPSGMTPERRSPAWGSPYSFQGAGVVVVVVVAALPWLSPAPRTLPPLLLFRLRGTALLLKRWRGAAVAVSRFCCLLGDLPQHGH